MRIFQVDAFADSAFTGNPAAVCLLDGPADAAWMQRVAAEMNLAETAFVEQYAGGYRLRWFTPAVEVALCGHATLASAHVLFSNGSPAPDEPIRFDSASGPLIARRAGQAITLDFPARPARPADLPPGLAEALGVAAPVWAGRSAEDFLVVLGSAGGGHRTAAGPGRAGGDRRPRHHRYGTFVQAGGGFRIPLLRPRGGGA